MREVGASIGGCTHRIALSQSDTIHPFRWLPEQPVAVLMWAFHTGDLLKAMWIAWGWAVQCETRSFVRDGRPQGHGVRMQTQAHLVIAIVFRIGGSTAMAAVFKEDNFATWLQVCDTSQLIIWDMQMIGDLIGPSQAGHLLCQVQGSSVPVKRHQSWIGDWWCWCI